MTADTKLYGILLDEMDYFVEMVDDALPLYIEKGQTQTATGK